MKRKCFLILLFLFLLPFSNVHSETIVSVPPEPGSPAIGGDGNSYLGMSWTASHAFTDVEISAWVYSSDTNHADATAYLTTQIGPGATSATMIASNNIALPFSSDSIPQFPELSLFSGLNLDPGTYYLILSAPSAGGYVRGWLNGGASTTAPGVTVIDEALAANDIHSFSDTIYPPASSWLTYAAKLGFDVTGTAVPEPSTMLLLGSGLLGLAVYGRKKFFKK